VNPPASPARYLNGKLVSVIATDYGGYAVTLTVSQLQPRFRHRPVRDPRAGHPAVLPPTSAMRRDATERGIHE
jgi:hypothetical protein